MLSVAPVFSGQLTTFGMTRASTTAAGEQVNSASQRPVFSPDGLKVAFDSSASNLVPGDTNSASDIFVKDLVTGAITRVSTNATGAQGNAYSLSPVFSPDGTQVAFKSGASNLVPGDTNGRQDIFVKDLVTGAITRVSTNAAGAEGNDTSSSFVFSSDGSKMAFYSEASNLVPGDTNSASDIFVKDLVTGAITRVNTDAAGTQANAWSYDPVFSPDGTKVAFSSAASNLVSGDTNGRQDIFVKDLVTGTITRVNTDAAGTQAISGSGYPVFSPDGTKVAFESHASNLVPGDTNGQKDIFVKDLVTGTITRVSTDAAGAQANSESGYPVFSPDGTKIAFSSYASNLVPTANGFSDIFVKNLVTGEITRASTGAGGFGSSGNTFSSVFSSDGTKVVFESSGSNLVTGDTNGFTDIFVASLGFRLSVVEGTTTVATLGATDRDPGTTLAYSISGTDAARLTINAATGALAFRNPPSFLSPADAGADNVYDIQVRVSDGVFTTAVPAKITVTKVNLAPTNIALSASTIVENNAANAVVGLLSTTDPDANNTFTYTLITGEGSTDNNAFSIVGNQLRANASFDFETQNSYSVRIRSTDQGGLSTEKAFTITVTDVNETPASAPTQVTATLSSGGTVDVRWYPPAVTGGLPVTSYLVRCSSNSGQSWFATIGPVNADPGENLMNIGGLTVGLPWVFSVAAVTGSGTGFYSSPTPAVTVVREPGSPSITSVVRGSQQATLAWTPPASTGGLAITDYTVQYSGDAGATWTTFVRPVASTATSNVIVNGLVNGVSYMFKVAAVNSVGRGGFSSPSAAITIGTVPGTPAAPVAKIGDKSITLTWTVPSSGGPPISGYTVRYSIAGANVWTSITPDAANVSAPTPTTRALTISGLTNDTPYVFNVAAFNQLGYGPYSSNSAAVTPLAPAAAPTGLTATRGDRSATVAFTAPVVPVNTPILGYQLQSSRDGLVWSNVKWPTAVPVLQTSAVLVGGLANGTAFQLRVAAVTAAGVGAFSNPVSVTPATLPGTVTGAPRAVIANGAATLTWNRPSSDGGSPIVDYVVQYAIAGSPTWTSFSHAPADVKSPTATSRSIVVNGLDNGTNYVFRVAAINDVGQAAAFSPNSSGATPLGPPGTPTDLAATRGNASATLSWTAPADNGGSPITRYLIESSRDGGVTWTAAKWPTGVDATATQNVVVTGLTNGTAYQFRVAAIAGTRKGSFSSPINVTPATVPGTVSAAPAGLRSDAAVVLTWNAPTSTGGSPIVDYVVQYTFSGSPTWIPFIHAPADVTSPTATRRSITVTGLANRTAYVFRVAAVNDVGTAAAFSPSSAPVILNVP